MVHSPLQIWWCCDTRKVPAQMSLLSPAQVPDAPPPKSKVFLPLILSELSVKATGPRYCPTPGTIASWISKWGFLGLCYVMAHWQVPASKTGTFSVGGKAAWKGKCWESEQWKEKLKHENGGGGGNSLVLLLDCSKVEPWLGSTKSHRGTLPATGEPAPELLAILLYLPSPSLWNHQWLPLVGFVCISLLTYAWEGDVHNY